MGSGARPWGGPRQAGTRPGSPRRGRPRAGCRCHRRWRGRTGTAAACPYGRPASCPSVASGDIPGGYRRTVEVVTAVSRGAGWATRSAVAVTSAVSAVAFGTGRWTSHGSRSKTRRIHDGSSGRCTRTHTRTCRGRGRGRGCGRGRGRAGPGRDAVAGDPRVVADLDGFVQLYASCGGAASAPGSRRAAAAVSG